MTITVFLAILFALMAAYALREYEFKSPMWWFSLIVMLFNCWTILDYALSL